MPSPVMVKGAMTETHVVSALLDKRARIDGEIANRRFQIMRLEVERAALDAVLRMFKADYDPSSVLPKRSFSKNPAGVKKGTGSREALTELRLAGQFLTAGELAERVLARLGKVASPEARGMLANTIVSTFSRRRDGAVVYDASSYPGRWGLATWNDSRTDSDHLWSQDTA